jgi:hypothetical protein
MAITVVSNFWALPPNWRETMWPQVQQLGVPELDAAFTKAAAILTNRTEVEVQDIADHLVQSIALTGGSSDPKYAVPDPRSIFAIYCCDGNGSAPPQWHFMEALAVGTVLALAGAWRTSDQAKITKQSSHSGKVLASARAFSEWLYLVHSLATSTETVDLLLPNLVRTAAKKKVTKNASKKSKGVWDAKLEPERQKVYAAYESGKPWGSTLDAATKIYFADVTKAVGSDQLYKWLLKYVKEKKKG